VVVLTYVVARKFGWDKF